MKRPDAGPVRTKSGLVHVHALVAPAEYDALKAEAAAMGQDGVSHSLLLRVILSRRYHLPKPAVATRYQKRPAKSDA